MNTIQWSPLLYYYHFPFTFESLSKTKLPCHRSLEEFTVGWQWWRCQHRQKSEKCNPSCASRKDWRSFRADKWVWQQFLHPFIKNAYPHASFRQTLKHRSRLILILVPMVSMSTLFGYRLPTHLVCIIMEVKLSRLPFCWSFSTSGISESSIGFDVLHQFALSFNLSSRKSTNLTVVILPNVMNVLHPYYPMPLQVLIPSHLNCFLWQPVEHLHAMPSNVRHQINSVGAFAFLRCRSVLSEKVKISCRKLQTILVLDIRLDDRP